MFGAIRRVIGYAALWIMVLAAMIAVGNVGVSRVSGDLALWSWPLVWVLLCVAGIMFVFNAVAYWVHADSAE